MKMDTAAFGGRMKRFASEFLTDKTISQLKKYFITGFSSFGLEYSLLIILTEYVDLWYILSNTIAFLVSFWFNFLLNRYWSFQSKNNFSRQLFLYMTLLLVNLGISNVLMYIITDIFGVVYLISKIMVVSVITMWNFIIYKRMIYR